MIGDFGSNDSNEQDVANLVKSWNPDFIVTVGDNNYPDGEAATIDANGGKYYHEFIHPYTGAYGAGAATNRFWPVIGNRDWENQTGPKLQPYFDYFTLPNNERYYDFVQGPVHFFMLDTDSREPDGIERSTHAQWHRCGSPLERALKIFILHHTSVLVATFWRLHALQGWGADVVVSFTRTSPAPPARRLPYLICGSAARSSVRSRAASRQHGAYVSFRRAQSRPAARRHLPRITRTGAVIDT